MKRNARISLRKKAYKKIRGGGIARKCWRRSKMKEGENSEEKK